MCLESSIIQSCQDGSRFIMFVPFIFLLFIVVYESDGDGDDDEVPTFRNKIFQI